MRSSNFEYEIAEKKYPPTLQTLLTINNSQYIVLLLYSNSKRTNSAYIQAKVPIYNL